ncbi:MAG TPA: hypothetical protein VJQ54_22985, partial [Candidatus Sulfotelmatobacter sp.]|nr:hypothetical protein [Candidatus Sulfotelmatobacter sp.]
FIVIVLSIVVGLIGLFGRESTDAGLERALVTFGGMLVGIFIAAFGQLLQVFLDISDSLLRIEDNSEALTAKAKDKHHALVA